MWNIFVHDPGAFFANQIFSVANLVATDSFPGYISGVFFIVLLLLIIRFGAGARAARKSIGRANIIVRRVKDKAEFRDKFMDIDSALRSHEENPKRYSRDRAISRGWHEYHETLILPADEDSRGYIRNTVRPYEFFNKDDLGFESTIWRQIPSLFVSVGLFFTFLGLIAALHGSGDIFAAGADAQSQRGGMQDLLKIASAKFIMSLSGLACSIVFNLTHKIMSSRIDHAILRFCDDLELRMQFLTPEGLGLEQLATIKDQTQQLKSFNSDLAAQVGRALDKNTDTLRNELPDRISRTLKEELSPLLDRVGQDSTDNVGGMVRDLGSQIHDNLNSSLSEISGTLSGVNAALTNVSQELGKSGTNVSNEIESAVLNLAATMERIRDGMKETSDSAANTMRHGSDQILEAMNRTLSAIEANTKESAGALSEAAKELASAANTMGQKVRDTADQAGTEVRATVEGAGQELIKGMSSISKSVAEEAGRFGSALEGTISKPIDNLAVAMEQLDTQLRSSAGSVDMHRQAVKDAASATTAANDALAVGSQHLVNAATPIRTSVQNIEAINKRIADALKESASSLVSNREVVERSLKSLEAAVEKFNTVTSRYDEIDEKLGDAFRTITGEIKTASDQVRNYATDIENNFSRGINSLLAAIDGAADFKPPNQ